MMLRSSNPPERRHAGRAVGGAAEETAAMGAIPLSSGGRSVRAPPERSPGIESAILPCSPVPGGALPVLSELPGQPVGALGKARVDIAQVGVRDSRWFDSERGEQGLPCFIEAPLGGLEHGEVVPWLRHVGMVAPEPIEYLDRLPRASLVCVQEPVEEPGPWVHGIALEEWLEHFPRFPVAFVVCQRHGEPEVFFE